MINMETSAKAKKAPVKKVYSVSKKSAASTKKKPRPASPRKVKKEESLFRQSMRVLFWSILASTALFSLAIGVMTSSCRLSMCETVKTSMFEHIGNWILPEYKDDAMRAKYLTTLAYGSKDVLPPLHDVKAAINANVPHLALVDGYASHYNGADWWTVQPMVGWNFTTIASATAVTNRDIVAYNDSGRSVNLTMLGVQRIGLDESYGQASRDEVQKCLDEGAQTRTLRLYHQGSLSSQRGVVVASNGKNCALELLKAGDSAYQSSDTDNLPKSTADIYKNHAAAAKTHRRGLYGI